MPNKIKRTSIDAFPYLINIDTRWMDNDIYGHVNNVTYYSYFDTIINRFLIEKGGLDIHQSEQIGLIVNSNCSYFESVAFPDKLVGGFSVSRIGTSSVDYKVAIFKQDEQLSVAIGSMTHVFVDRATSIACPISGKLKEALQKASAKA